MAGVIKVYLKGGRVVLDENDGKPKFFDLDAEVDSTRENPRSTVIGMVTLLNKSNPNQSWEVPFGDLQDDRGDSVGSTEEDIMTYLSTIIKGFGSPVTSTASTPGVLDITNTVGSTLNTWKSFTVVCVAGTVDIGTETFPVGTYSFANGNGTLNSIAYDASSSTDCKIIFIA